MRKSLKEIPALFHVKNPCHFDMLIFFQSQVKISKILKDVLGLPVCLPPSPKMSSPLKSSFP